MNREIQCRFTIIHGGWTIPLHFVYYDGKFIQYDFLLIDTVNASDDPFINLYIETKPYWKDILNVPYIIDRQLHFPLIVFDFYLIEKFFVFVHIHIVVQDVSLLNLNIIQRKMLNWVELFLVYQSFYNKPHYFLLIKDDSKDYVSKCFVNCI